MSFSHSYPAFLEELERRLLMSGSSALADFFASAQGVDIVAAGSVAVSGSIADAAEGKFYQITAPAKGKLCIDMVADGDELDPFLQVFSARGRRIRTNDNASRRTLNSRMLLGVQPGQTLYVRASGAKKTSGGYTLTVTTDPVDDYGNTFSSAKAMSLTATGLGWKTGQINYGGDVDMFKVVAAKTGTIQITMTGTDRRNTLAPQLAAYDAGGRLLAESQNSPCGGTAVVSFDAAQGSTCYVKAAGSGGTVGRYLLSVVTAEKDVVGPQPPQPAQQYVPTPGMTITTQVVSQSNGLQLLVVGTDQNDTITLSQSAGATVLTTGAGSRTIVGNFAGVTVYGFAGNDVIRLTNTLTPGARVYAGDGDDTILDAGTGADVLYGEAGNDLLVSVGGTSDTLRGQDGFDSFWCDASDTLADASSSEAAAGSVHRISQFLQPFTSDPNTPGYVPLEIASQNLQDPAMGDYPRAYVSFASRPLFVDAPEYNDVAQGYLGDCYYLASLASIADTDPGIIRQTIAPMGDGTYAVRFYRNGQEVYLRIDADLPVTSGSCLAYAKLSPEGETWVPLLEKAYAYFRYGQNSYASLNGGWMSTVYQEVTGCATSQRWTTGSSEQLFTFIQSSLAAGHPVTMGSYSSASGPIVGGHAYMLKSVQTGQDGSFVTVYNPWGVDGTSWDSNPRDGLLTISMRLVQQYFSCVVVSMA